jgi:Helix-turn-helix domain
MNASPTIACKILTHLEKGKSLTAIQALDMFGTMRLGTRIHELRAEGIPIIKETIKRNGKSFARYSINR